MYRTNRNFGPKDQTNKMYDNSFPPGLRPGSDGGDLLRDHVGLGLGPQCQEVEDPGPGGAAFPWRRCAGCCRWPTSGSALWPSTQPPSRTPSRRDSRWTGYEPSIPTLLSPFCLCLLSSHPAMSNLHLVILPSPPGILSSYPSPSCHSAIYTWSLPPPGSPW